MVIVTDLHKMVLLMLSPDAQVCLAMIVVWTAVFPATVPKSRRPATASLRQHPGFLLHRLRCNLFPQRKVDVMRHRIGINPI